MGADTYSREGDFTDDEAAAKGGRAEQDSSQLDAEFDAILAVVNSHADDIDKVLRDDDKLLDDILEGHEFSAAAISLLKGLIGNENAALVWRGTWVTATDYEAGDLVEDSGNAYVCLVAHTSGTFATDLSASKWDLFASKGAGASFPGGASANDVLYNTGAAEAWGKVTAAMAPLHALISNTNLTGTATVVNMTFSGDLVLPGAKKFTPGINSSIAGTAAAPIFNFDLGIMQTFSVTAAITGTTSANKANGKLTEIRFLADSSDRAVTWNASWEWLGAKPTQITANKNGLLSLRCYGTAETDVVASWNEEW
jgi:hypothetical protein